VRFTVLHSPTNYFLCNLLLYFLGMRHGVPLSYKTVASCSDLKNLHSFVTLSDALSFFRSMLAVFFKYDCSLLRVRNQCYEHGNEPLSSAETNFLTC
jgi:hypothetical protein